MAAVKAIAAVRAMPAGIAIAAKAAMRLVITMLILGGDEKDVDESLEDKVRLIIDS